MEDSRKANRIMERRPELRRARGRPKKIRLKDVLGDIKAIGVRGWKRIIRNQTKWSDRAG